MVSGFLEQLEADSWGMRQLEALHDRPLADTQCLCVWTFTLLC